MSLFGLSIAAPLVLFGLLALPLIWWLLRLTPPRPREEVFPPTRILAEIARKEETPAQSPWWLTLLRLLMAALVILALAEPIWNAQEKLISGKRTMLMVVDDGWSSGQDWDDRKSTAQRLLEEAETAGNPVALVFTSQGGQADLTPKRADTLKAVLAAATALPLPVDLTPLSEKLNATKINFETIAWLSSGLENAGTGNFIETIGTKGISNTLYFSSDISRLNVLTNVNNAPDALQVDARRATKENVQSGRATAFDLKGRSISSTDFTFASDSKIAGVKFILPVELRNEIVRISIDENTHAGSVQLLDDRFQRRRVGLISGGNADLAQPLLSPLYYISRALKPFSEVRESRLSNVSDAVPQLIEERISTLVLADIGTISDETSEQLEKWVNRGGMLIRFAGPRLATAENDTLVPVELRRGGRSLGGTLTWGTPQPLDSFAAESPFNGITVPEDVSVTRQVLAEPDIDLEEKTWASLSDGTPLVTAAKRGQGWIVLFHVTADASWSNLPLSGAFVDMLRRIVAVSKGVISADNSQPDAAGLSAGNTLEAEISLPPLRSIDGFGKFVQPGSDVQPLVVSSGAKNTVTVENPPGTYGTSDAFVAINLFENAVDLKPIDVSKLPENTVQSGYSKSESSILKPWLLALAVILLTLDCIVVLWMAGALRRRAVSTASALVALSVLGYASGFPLSKAIAQDAEINIEDTLRTRLAYVVTGDQRTDQISEKGLKGLTQFIGSRTSLEPGDPVGVDISKDELAFYPLLYWPISTTSPVPDAKTMARVDAFMKKGGSVLFDTRDQLSGGFGGQRVSSETLKLREILASLDVPRLEPVPDNHVLTRAFYLLSVFPGRYLDGKLWVETSETEDEESSDRPTRQGDGVSSLMITSNDLAAAWAIEADGSPSLPIVPPNPTQRVYAYRTGVNIVMYTLTGNYKSDQVHIPALLERLGQ